MRADVSYYCFMISKIEGKRVNKKQVYSKSFVWGNKMLTSTLLGVSYCKVKMVNEDIRLEKQKRNKTLKNKRRESSVINYFSKLEFNPLGSSLVHK